MSGTISVVDCGSSGVKSEGSEGGPKPSPAKITTGRFRMSGMTAGALEQYLVPSNSHRVRAESPDLEIVFDSTGRGSPSILDLRNPQEVFSTPIKRSGSPDPDIEFLGSFQRGGNNEESQTQVMCRKNSDFKSDPEDSNSSGQNSFAESVEEENGVTKIPLESTVLSSRPINLPATSQPVGQGVNELLLSSGSTDSGGESEEDIRSGAHVKRKIKFSFVTPAEKKRCVPLEEKENEIAVSSINLPPEVAKNVEVQANNFENEKITSVFSEKKRSCTNLEKTVEKQSHLTGKISGSQGNSPSNLIRESPPIRASSPQISLSSPRLNLPVQVDSPHKKTVIGKLIPISTNNSVVRSNDMEEVSSETARVSSVDALNRSTTTDAPVQLEADLLSTKSKQVCMNALVGTKFMSHIAGNTLKMSVELPKTNETKIAEIMDPSSRKRTLDVLDRGEIGSTAIQNGDTTKRRKVEPSVQEPPESGTKSSKGGRPKKHKDANWPKTKEDRKVQPAIVKRAENSNGSDSGAAPSSSTRDSNSPANISDIRILKLRKSNEEYADLWEKKMYNEVLMKLTKDVADSKIPSEDFAAEVIWTCILRLSGRISKKVCSCANTFFYQLAEKVTVRKYFCDVFDSITTDLKAQNNRVVDLLLMSLKSEFKLKPDEKLALQFLKTLTFLCEKDFEQYQTNFKLRQPLFVQLMMDPDSHYAADYNGNWSHFLKYVKDFSPSTEEAEILMNWVDLMATHYMDKGVKQLVEDGAERLKEDLVTNIIERRDKDLGFQFVLLLKKSKFSLDVSRTLFCDYLPRLEQPVGDWTNILLELCAHLPGPPAQPAISGRAEPELEPELKQIYEFIMAKVNTKGECNLHIVCQGKKRSLGFGSNKKEYDARMLFSLMKSKKIGDINVTDNNGNTPLHEASYHGKTDVIQLIWEFFTEESKPPGPFRVDILAQNGFGKTALHEAVEQRQSDSVATLRLMAKNAGCLENLLRIRTKAKKTAHDLLKQQTDAVSEEIRKALSDCPGKVRQYFGGVKFPEETISLIESEKKLHAFLFYWRDSYKNMQKEDFKFYSDIADVST